MFVHKDLQYTIQTCLQFPINHCLISLRNSTVTQFKQLNIVRMYFIIIFHDSRLIILSCQLSLKSIHFKKIIRLVLEDQGPYLWLRRKKNVLKEKKYS